MTANVPIERLEANYANGFAAQTLMLDDYLRANVPEDAARRMVNGVDGDTLETLVRNMAGNTKEYYGVREDSLLTGFASLGEWLPRDEEPFMGRVEFITARLAHKALKTVNQDAPSEYDGIHAFAVADYVDYDTTALSLLNGVRIRSGERGKPYLYITVDAEDEQLRGVLEREADSSFRKFGQQTLYGVTRDYFLRRLETR